ncbi:Zinc finger C2H2-type [Fusarium oxysporum f. sp. vasinfectum]|nr:Zinc finger C2H2-type [Fusarium oxysporum f. sp. vasinfectum]KAK2926504.1 Zinc finger C2H2-type [Fusarium oxysporum f. sp. vasinfectum]
MGAMELVENEPTARPFQCGWRSCTKSFKRKSDLQRHYRIHTNERPYACSISGCGKTFIQKSALTVHIRIHTGEKPHQCHHNNCGKRFSDSSSLARHRRVHTGARPYKCTYDGCSRSFCRKATMVEHQRRSHQHEMNPNDILHDFSSDSEDNEPPLTPQHSAMTWSPHDIVSMDQAIPHGPIHNPTSYADFDQPVHGQHMPHQYANRHGISSNVPRKSHGQPVPGYYVRAPTPRRTITTPGQIYHITERGNPGILSMANTARPHQQLPQEVERPPIELPYSTLAIAAPARTSPRTFSTTSISSSGVQECLCKYLLEHEPEYPQADTQQSIIQYQQYIQNIISQPQQPVTSQARTIHALAAKHSPQMSAQAQQEKWSNYVLSTEATTIRQLPAYGNAVYDPYEAKIEVDDPLMQLPSRRLASM